MTVGIRTGAAHVNGVAPLISEVIVKRSIILVALLALTAITVGPAGPALAGPPSTYDYDLTYADCGFDVDTGWVGLQLFRPNLVNEYSEQPAIYIQVYQAEDDVWNQTANPTDVEFVGDGFEAELELYSEATGDVVGTATVLGTLEQVGDVEFRFDDQRKAGNSLVREYQSGAEVVVTGWLEVSIEGYSGTFDLSEGCSGERTVGTIHQTNPAGFTNHWWSVYFGCDVTSADGWTAAVAVDKVQGDGQVPPNFEVNAWAPGMSLDDEPALAGWGHDVKTTASSLSAEVDLWDTRSDAPDGMAVIEATFTTGAVFEYELFFEGARVVWEFTTLIVEGNLTIEDTVFELDGCEGELVSVDTVAHPTQSQGKGKIPANDLPEGAFALERVSNDHNRLASPEPEAPCVIDEDEEIPLGKTLWYTLGGTGETLTVTTDGSDFDTVIGVYTLVDGEFVQLACVDDVAGEDYYTNLATVEFATTAGDTYYLQVGGYDGQSGLLKVAVD
ncbi:MAG: hypothetical protein OEW30_11535 [Acidimicrobiia bacterium]|nr:hypothetical protein [Acidimicrobiia bacterium]